MLEAQSKAFHRQGREGRKVKSKPHRRGRREKRRGRTERFDWLRRRKICEQNEILNGSCCTLLCYICWLRLRLSLEIAYMLIEQQIAERQTRAKDAVEHILERPASGLYGDYRIRSASKNIYRVALRGPGLFENYCSCPDFAINTLGTCKHIEAVLLRLRQKHGSALEQEQFRRNRASISLHYGEDIGIRLRLPASPSRALEALAKQYFDSQGLLRP